MTTTKSIVLDVFKMGYNEDLVKTCYYSSVITSNIHYMTLMQGFKSELPTSGVRMETRCFDNWYVGELMKGTIGHRGSHVCAPLGARTVGGSSLLSCVTIHTGVLWWHLLLKGREVEHSSISPGLGWGPLWASCMCWCQQAMPWSSHHMQSGQWWLWHFPCSLGNDNGFCLSECFDGLLLFWGEVGGWWFALCQAASSPCPLELCFWCAHSAEATLHCCNRNSLGCWGKIQTSSCGVLTDDYTVHDSE